MRWPQRGKPLSEIKTKMLLRQYRMMGMGVKTNWSELARRCGVHASTAKKYIEAYSAKKT